jgi:hypothetical protein
MAEGRDVEDILAELLADDDDADTLVGAANAAIYHSHMPSQPRLCISPLAWMSQ